MSAPDDTEEVLPRPSWRIRRRIIILTLLFCAGEVVYLTGWGRDTGLHEAMANGAWFLAGAVIGAYVFGASWDDANILSAASRTRRPRRVDFDGGDAPPPPPGYAS